MLKKVLDKLRYRNKNVDYELHRRTYKGGWKTHWPDVYFDLPMDKPEADDEWPIDEYPGHYRLVKRIDGRITETLWTYKTDDADTFYDRRRREAEQKERLQQMTIDELNDELIGESNELDALDYSTIKDRFEELGGYDQLHQTTD